MKESFIKFNFQRLKKYVDRLKKIHSERRKELKILKGEYIEKIHKLQEETTKNIKEKNKKIRELNIYLQDLKEQSELYENKLNVIPGFILKRYNKNII